MFDLFLGTVYAVVSVCLRKRERERKEKEILKSYVVKSFIACTIQQMEPG
jgi:hypothetical protein